MLRLGGLLYGFSIPIKTIFSSYFMKIILDTNFLIYCAKEKIDYVEKLQSMFHEHFDLVVPEQVIEELDVVMNKKKTKIPFVRRTARFKKTTGRDKEAASLALQIVEKYISEKIISIVKAEGNTVDEALINLAQENKKNIVCTLDREMRETLGRVVLMNKNKQLILSR
ncbi:MAG: hypothetical protein RL557_693 [archaeon]|jgi:rRNA-processing protein FCF1